MATKAAKWVVRQVDPSNMPDGNWQFLQSGLPLPDDVWIQLDHWDADTATKLITIGFPVDLKCMVEEAKGWPADAYGRHRLSAMITVYYRARQIADSSISAGLLRD